MGAVDLGSGSGRRVKSGSGIKKPKRVGFVLDMTPLVDIAFLLLTFFMFATTMTQPQIMEMRVPPQIDDPIPVKESTLLNLYIDPENDLYYNTGADTTFQTLTMRELRDFAVKRNAQMENDLITVLKLHPESDYGTMVAVLDELNKAEGMLTAAYEEEGRERKRKFSIQPLLEAEKERLEQL